MITAELRRAIVAAAGAAGYSGECADPGLRATGAPGRYASSLPFRLAAGSDGQPCEIAAALATRLGDLPWLESAAVTGAGYLTITVTHDALAALAVRITVAGPACARSDALSDLTMTAPPASARTAIDWPQAKEALAAHLTARLATAAGARVTTSNDPERVVVSAFPTGGGMSGGAPGGEPRGQEITGLASTGTGSTGPEPAPGKRVATARSGSLPAESGHDRPDGGRPAPAAGAETVRRTDATIRSGSLPAQPDLDGPRGGQPAAAPESPVARAIAYAGRDAVRCALARLPPGVPAEVDAAACARQVPENPAFAVRYAHACASSELRWAAACGVTKGDPDEFRPGLLTDPWELALLDAASWLPERVAAAARRGRPDEFCGYLEDLAGAYQNCFAGNPVWPACCAGEEPAAVRPGEAGESGARDPVRARLWLADAARTSLGAGLGLLEVSAPDRL